MSSQGTLVNSLRQAVDSLRAVTASLEQVIEQSQHGSYSGATVPRAPASGEWDVVSEPPSSAAAQAPVRRLPGSISGYDEIASLITACPQHCLDLCSRLEDSRSRAQRAWEAGHWARATIEGRIPKPRPTPKINYRPSVYVVVCGPGIAYPVAVGSASEYFKLVPRFTENSVSHSFPSIAEAKVYCLAIGIDFPGEQ